MVHIAERSYSSFIGANQAAFALRPVILNAVQSPIAALRISRPLQSIRFPGPVWLSRQVKTFRQVAAMREQSIAIYPASSHDRLMIYSRSSFGIRLRNTKEDRNIQNIIYNA
jgi:hypothetical protein